MQMLDLCGSDYFGFMLEVLVFLLHRVLGFGHQLQVGVGRFSEALQIQSPSPSLNIELSQQVVKKCVGHN